MGNKNNAKRGVLGIMKHTKRKKEAAGKKLDCLL